MYPSAFRYERPDSLEGVLDLLAEHGDDARPLAGGQSLIPLMKLRVVHPEVLVDLQGLPGDPDRIVVDDTWLRFGPLTRHAQVETSADLATRGPMVVEAMHHLADVQVRNRGTVAGSLAEADPAGDWGPLMLAMGGEVVCTSHRGERIVGHDTLFVDYLTSDLAEDELLTEIRLRTPPRLRSGGAYLKLERRVGDFAVVAAGAQLTVDAEGRCTSIGIGLGGVALVPVKAESVEQALLGSMLDETTVTEAFDAIADQLEPISDGRGPGWYKRDMARVFVTRAVTLAAARARAVGGTATDGHDGRARA